MSTHEAPPRVSARRAGQRTALWLLIRPSRADASEIVLPVIAIAVITAVSIAVSTLAYAFWFAPDPSGFGQYQILAVAMLAVMVVPVSTLGSSAARLSARRREDRLATLRLMGATPRWVRKVALVEAGLLALSGAILGAALALPITPALALVPVAGNTLGIDRAILPPALVVVLASCVVLVALISAVASLKQVMISPLGVRMRQSAPRMHWLRLVIAALVVAGAVLVPQLTSASWGTVGITLALVLVIVSVMAVLNILGPFLVGRSAQRRLRRSDNAASLIAARTVLESPQAAWRQVSGGALASFIAVPAGSVLGFLDMVQNVSDAVTPEQIQFFGDIRTVVVAALAVAYLLVACSVGVTQAAAVMERRALYVSLDRLGMSQPVMHRSRRMAISIPLLVAAVVPAVIAAVLVIPVVGVSAVTAPLFLLTVIGCIVLGMLLVQLGVIATFPVLRRVLAAPERAL